MSKQSSKADLIVELLEEVIDSRYKYLKELDFENHRCASEIKEKLYKPAVKSLIKALEKKD
jgi:hypothetical protein